jgi:hypothetical protein
MSWKKKGRKNKERMIKKQGELNRTVGRYASKHGEGWMKRGPVR